VPKVPTVAKNLQDYLKALSKGEIKYQNAGKSMIGWCQKLKIATVSFIVKISTAVHTCRTQICRDMMFTNSVY